VRTQSLVRLLQERLVERYARRHSIHLTADDQAQIDLELAQLEAGSAPTRRLFSRHTVDRSFMREVLVRQLLVQKVQARIAGSQDVAGFEFHVRRLVFPVPPGGDRKAVTRQAIAVARRGPLPPGTVQKKEWVAPFRLLPSMRAALEIAPPGKYVGPFDSARSIVLLQLLGSGEHRYGAPARAWIEANAFRQWLRRQVHRVRLRCSNSRGILAPCPSRIMNSV
jgi:hypothetical protein